MVTALEAGPKTVGIVGTTVPVGTTVVTPNRIAQAIRRVADSGDS